MPQRSPPIRVFLADDSAPIRQRLAALLEAAHMEVVGQAETPRSCIDGILASRPDVVVLDAFLAGGSGLEVLRGIRPAAPEIAFVVFSIHTAQAYREHYLAAGATCYLDKAAEFDQLVGEVTAAAVRAR